MLVQVNTDHNIEGSDRLARYVESELEAKLGRFQEQITRIEVHLNDTNAGKSGPDDKRCQMEARVAGKSPLSVTHNASDMDAAIHGAMSKLKKLLTKTAEGREHPRGRPEFPRENLETQDDDQ